MGKYRLSRKADQDIQAIFEFGAERFGIAQAESYLTGLHKQLDLIIVLGTLILLRVVFDFYRAVCRWFSTSSM